MILMAEVVRQRPGEEALVQPGHTRHAQYRCAQRGISTEAIAAAVDWGMTRDVGDGCVAYFLGRRALARAARVGVSLDELHGTTAILSPENRLVTAYIGDRPPLGQRRARRRTARRPR